MSKRQTADQLLRTLVQRREEQQELAYRRNSFLRGCQHRTGGRTVGAFGENDDDVPRRCWGSICVERYASPPGWCPSCTEAQALKPALVLANRRVGRALAAITAYVRRGQSRCGSCAHFTDHSELVGAADNSGMMVCPPCQAGLVQEVNEDERRWHQEH